MAHIPSFRFIWKIKNFTLSQSWNVDDKIESQYFSILSLEKDFRLLVCPKGLTESSYHVQLGLWIGKSSLRNTVIDYELSFLSADDCPLLSRRNSWTVSEGEICWLENCPTQDEVYVTKRSVFLPGDVLKVQCELWTSSGVVARPRVVYSNGVLRYDTEREFQFYINDFSKLRVGEKKVYNAEPILFDLTIRSTLQLTGSEEMMEKADVDIYITRNISTMKTICRLILGNLYSEYMISPQITGVYTKGEYIYNFEKFTTRQKVVESYKFVDEDVFTLYCEFVEAKYFQKQDQTIQQILIPAYEYNKNTLLDKTNENFASEILESNHPLPTPNQSSSTELQSLPMLQDDLLSLYKEHKFSDFELRTEGTSFPVHKNILAARSPVFRALFSSDMREIVSGFQNVPDINKKTLDQMLLFVYTDIVRDLQWEEATNLYYAADKYQILRLKEKCSSYLQTKLDGSNVCEILELAVGHDDGTLKSAVEEFLLDHAEETMKSEEWRMFKNRNPQLSADTMYQMFSRLTIKRK